jgi:NDP-sugar pyrophosphorylase family protein
MPEVFDAIVLCGGAGLRLKSITGETPKALADITGRPFLEILLRQLRRNNFQRVILAVGYQGEMIRSQFGARAFGLSLDYSVEKNPLGTAGALRQAVELVGTDSVLILNGDSYTPADLQGCVSEHREGKPDLTVVVVPRDGRDDCGLVALGPRGNVIGFKEKQSSSGNLYLNAGIYLAARSLLCEIPVPVNLSLEEQLIPQWLVKGKTIRAFVSPTKCTDIGTPERYWKALATLANVEVDANMEKLQMEEK